MGIDYMPRLTRSLLFVLGQCALVACNDATTLPSQPDLAEVPSAEAPTFAVGSNTWAARAPMPIDFAGLAAGVMNNGAGQPIVYALGGITNDDERMNSTVAIYNVATNAWTVQYPRNNRPFLRVRPNGIGRIGTRLYISGGFEPIHTPDIRGYSAGTLQSALFAYLPATNTLEGQSLYPMPQATADGVTGVIEGKLYVLAGTAAAPPPPAGCFEDCPLATIRTLYRYDPAANRWTTMTQSPHYHRNGAGGVIQGKFYVAGGFNERGEPTSYLDAYNPMTNAWTRLANMPAASTGLKGAVVQNRLYVIGPRATYVYDPVANTWKVGAAPPVGSSAAIGGSAAVPVTLDGRPRIVVVGGNNTASGAQRPTSIYTP